MWALRPVGDRSRCRCQPSRCPRVVPWPPTIAAVREASMHTSRAFRPDSAGPAKSTVQDHSCRGAPRKRAAAGREPGGGGSLTWPQCRSSASR